MDKDEQQSKGDMLSSRQPAGRPRRETARAHQSR